MTWLLIHAWALLVLSALIGFAVGWLIRGAPPRSFRSHAGGVVGLGSYQLAELPPLNTSGPKPMSTTFPSDHPLWRPQAATPKAAPSRELTPPANPMGSTPAAISALAVLTPDEVEARVLSAAPVAPPLLAGPDGTADDLKRLIGVGPANEAALNDLGVFHFRQIAAWDAAQVAWVSEKIAFSGRIVRENWMAQAAVLMSETPPS